ncbi:hypothetical protein [Microbulbifer sp. 2205BS26-8]|uniref:hypothetical protein n=1 Tax=Microbulbifer sp. 2205BS26-8 TaxID=3064386 RepID=UPI00273F539D|nr:hypothetical protein [Microbulbifer sp. 2205BS26-8]MDP5209677.1 hypothetical protein [Microbulbifer sp. 2205BS26-8]
MPASLAAGTPYGLCHGDNRSALLLTVLTGPAGEHHHSGHDHDTLTAHSFADTHCAYSAVAGVAGTPATVSDILSGGVSSPPTIPKVRIVLPGLFERPLIRAPPHGAFPFKQLAALLLL